METLWQRRRILIWGKTCPELSKKYREIVCTGGVFEDTKKLVRLYPIPLRYIDDEKILKNINGWKRMWPGRVQTPDLRVIRFEQIIL